MAVKPVGAPQGSGGSGAGSELAVSIPLPTGISLCQVVLCNVQISGAGSPTGLPTVTFGESGWVKVTEIQFGLRGLQTYLKVFSGTKVPANASATLRWESSTSIFWDSSSEAYDEVSPITPVDVAVATRGTGTELNIASVTATANGVGGRIVSAIKSNNSVTHTSVGSVQENLLAAAPGIRSIWQDPGLIAAPGATGVRPFSYSGTSESFGTNVLLIAGPAATEQKIVPTPEGTGYFYNSKKAS